MLSLGTLSGFADSMGSSSSSLLWMLTDANGKGFWDILTLFVPFENF
jgi:hypothetical protein